MNQRRSFNVSFPVDFIESWEEYKKLVEKNKEYCKALEEKITRDKRLKDKTKQNAIKIRFAILHTLRELRKSQQLREIQKLNKEEGINEETKGGDIQAESF